MKHSFILKISIWAIFISGFAINVHAQKINEKDLKVNIVQISNPLNHLKELEPIRFNYNLDKQKTLNLPKGAQYGFITQSLSTYFPAMVYETGKMYSAGKNQFKTATYDEVKMENLIPILVAAINAQQEQIDALKTEIEVLKKK